MPALVKPAYTEESAEVEVLLANTEKLKSLTKRIQGSIEKLNTSGLQIQAAIKPIYGNTSKLQVTANSECYSLFRRKGYSDKTQISIESIMQSASCASLWTRRDEKIPLFVLGRIGPLTVSRLSDSHQTPGNTSS